MRMQPTRLVGSDYIMRKDFVLRQPLLCTGDSLLNIMVMEEVGTAIAVMDGRKREKMRLIILVLKNAV